MTSASPADIQGLVGAASKIDWTSMAKAIGSHFTDKGADLSAAVSVEPLMDELAPIIAPYVLGAIASSAIPLLGVIIPLLVPAVAIAIMEFKGGDPDPIHDAQTTESRGGRTY